MIPDLAMLRAVFLGMKAGVGMWNGNSGVRMVVQRCSERDFYSGLGKTDGRVSGGVPLGAKGCVQRDIWRGIGVRLVHRVGDRGGAAWGRGR